MAKRFQGRTLKATRKKAKNNPLELALRDVEDRLEQAARYSYQAYERTVATWSGPPSFHMRKIRRGRDVIWQIGPNPGTWGYHKFRYVDEGTSVRYATMTDNFVPKTSHRRLSSSAGRGGVKKIDVRDPKPGIEARQFTQEIAKNAREVFLSQRQIQALIRKRLAK